MSVTWLNHTGQKCEWAQMFHFDSRSLFVWTVLPSSLHAENVKVDFKKGKTLQVTQVFSSIIAILNKSYKIIEHIIVRRSKSNGNFLAEKKIKPWMPLGIEKHRVSNRWALLSNVFMSFSSGKYRTNNAKLNNTRIFMHVRKTEWHKQQMLMWEKRATVRVNVDKERKKLVIFSQAPSLSTFTLTVALFPTLGSVVCVTLFFAHA